MILYDSYVSGSLTISSSATVGGTLTAQTIVVQTITSSTDFVTGSSRFGTLAANTHQFTGSLFQTGSTAAFMGNVGVGTTSPGAIFDVNGALSNGRSIIRVTNSDTANYVTVGAGIPGITNAGMNFTLDGTSRMAISANGLVGIGTTSPLYVLHAVTASTSIAAFRNSGAAIGQILVGNTAGDLALRTLASGDALIFSDTSKYLAFGTGGGSERMRIDSTGSVGIGTTTPAYLLDVNGTGRFSQTGATPLTVQRTTANSNVGIRYQNNTTSWYNGLASDDAFGISFNDANLATGQFKITTTGNVGIGLTSPSARLHVSGTTGGVFEVDGASAINALYVSASGNVGIGTTVPSQNLHISTSATATLRLQGASSTGFDIQNDNTGGYLWNRDNTVIYFGTNNTERMRITNTGLVGIGTTSPTSLLHVVTGSEGNIARFNQSSGYPIILHTTGSNNSYYGTSIIMSADSGSTQAGMRIWTRFASGGGVAMTFEASTNSQGYGANPTELSYSERMRITQAGNIGIGTTNPQSNLVVQNTSGTSIPSLGSNGGHFQLQNGTYGLLAGISGAGYTWMQAARTDGTATAYNLILQPNGGNVGIGTISPNEKLQVAGNIHAYVTSGVDSSILASNIGGSTTIYLRSNGVTYFNGGNVGIGTTSPGSLLHLQSSAPVVRLTNSAAGTGAGSVQYYSGSTQIWNLGTHTNNDMYLYNNITGTYNYWIQNSTGYVGIGTTSPNALLNVVASGAKSTISIGNTAASTYSQLLMYGGATKYNWSIGAQYNVNNALEITPSNATGSTTFTTPTVTILQSGNVGIGTTSPSTKLDVSGSARATLSLAVGNITPSATVGRIDASNDVVAYSTSDARFKTNIFPISSSLEKIQQISGVEFDWVPDIKHGYEGHDVGVIAQELEKVLPEVVTTRDNGYKAVKYEKIVPLLIEAIKEQQKQIDELRAKLS